MPTKSMRKLRLPVITRVAIRNYPLYRGTDGDFVLEHEVPEGVCVVVGVNGQGKTTCWRRPSFDHPCRLSIDQGRNAFRGAVGCG